MTFEFDGEKYQKASSHQKKWGAKLLSEFNFQGSENILDLGCGDGAITSNLANQVPDGYVLGIDASQGMIKTAKETHKQNNLKFKLLDIDSISFKNEFDIIFSNAALHWVKDHKQLLNNIHSALKDNATVRFNFAGNGNCSYFYNVIKQIMQLPEYAKYFKNFVWPWYMPDIEEYKSLTEQFSFSEIAVWGENADRNFPNAEAIVKWIDQPSIVPFLKCITLEEDANSFRNSVVKKMVLETTQKDGTCFETFRRVNLRATKKISLFRQICG